MPQKYEKLAAEQGWRRRQEIQEFYRDRSRTDWDGSAATEPCYKAPLETERRLASSRTKRVAPGMSGMPPEMIKEALRTGGPADELMKELMKKRTLTLTLTLTP